MAPQIVIGVDGSESSLHALAAGADLAEQTGSQLSVVFVRDPSLAGNAGAGEPAGASVSGEAAAERGARERTFDALRDRHLAWSFDTAAGDVTHELENVAQRRHAPLIIVGGHRHDAREGVGSVTEHLVRDLSVSVLVVGEPGLEPSPTPGDRRPAQGTTPNAVGVPTGSHRDRARPDQRRTKADR
jgi:nucleotide-binding universal stress UspA family protein